MRVLTRSKPLVFIVILMLFRVSYLTLDFRRLSTSIRNPFAASPKLETLLVSAFYPLAKSKHTHEEFAKWLALFLPRVTTHIYFFAPPEI